MSAGIIPVKSDKIDAYKAREGFFVVCQKAIPIKAIIKHAMSVFAHPPIPYLMLSPKRRIACSADAPASHMATVSCCANREAVVITAIKSNTSLVALCGLAFPLTIACIN